MITKTLTRDERMLVCFYTEAMSDAESVHVVGDFNDWDTHAHPMKQLKDGRFWAKRVFHPGERHEYRYLVDGEMWINDSQAEQYVPNPHGSDNCVVTT